MDAYTPIDHEVWRYIMRVNRAFFANHAHQKYLTGLENTGISIDRIPSVESMDKKLKRFGWRAVPVSGFIPPTAFMEFQSLGILPIACDMRVPEHTAYTPAPDIVHESAGHAPILIDPEYAEYLRAFGAVATKAIYNHHDQAMYEAVRALSIVKEDLDSTPADVARAEERLAKAYRDAAEAPPSEAALLARLFWWTVEYGLIETEAETKIYGAGLLSSVGESHSCWSPKVKKIPLSIECLNQSYDITKPQPQLYVTPSFTRLTEVLREYEATMGFRVGGVAGLEKAKIGATVSTVELDTGLQIGGVVESWIAQAGKVVFVKLKGPTQLAYKDQELQGHGPHYHAHGYSTPLGPVSLADAKRGNLKFPGGIEMTATYQSHLERDGKLLVVKYDRCTIKRGSEILYNPDWGNFDLGIGERVVSVFGGAADRVKYAAATGGFQQLPRDHRGNSRPENTKLEALYGELRECRESGPTIEGVNRIYQKGESYPHEWLLRLSLLEMSKGLGGADELVQTLQQELLSIAKNQPTHGSLIQAGLGLL